MLSFRRGMYKYKYKKNELIRQGKVRTQWRFYIELLSGQDPLWALLHPFEKKKTHNFAQTAMFYYNNISVR